MDYSILKSSIEEFMDFPQKGIGFKDISPLLEDADKFSLAIEGMCSLLENIKFNKIVAIESRGFIFAAAIAQKLKKGIIMCRKPGKLPGIRVEKKYNYEYASSALSIQQSRLTSSDRVLIIDDVLATGNTALATYDIATTQAEVAGFLFFIELNFLQGRKFLRKHTSLSPKKIHSLIHY